MISTWTTNVQASNSTLFFGRRLCGHCGSPGVGHLHPLDVLLADDLVLDDGLWIIFADDAAGCLLDTAWGFPGLIDILSWKLLQLREVFPLKVEKNKSSSRLDSTRQLSALTHFRNLLDVVSVFVRLLAERHGRVDSEELVEERAR